LLQKGDVEKATRVLARVSLWGKRELPPGRLVTQDEKEDILKQAKDNPAINTSYSISDKIVCSENSIHKPQSYGAIVSEGESAKTSSETSEESPLLNSKTKVSMSVDKSILMLFTVLMLLIRYISNAAWISHCIYACCRKEK